MKDENCTLTIGDRQQRSSGDFSCAGCTLVPTVCAGITAAILSDAPAAATAAAGGGGGGGGGDADTTGTTTGTTTGGGGEGRSG